MKIQIHNIEENEEKVMLDDEEYERHIVQIQIGAYSFAVNRNELMAALIAFDAYDSKQNHSDYND